MRPGAGQGLGSWPGAQAQTQGMGLTEWAGTWLSVLNHFPSSDSASLDQVNHWKPDPPALTRPMRSFTSIQMFHTHTHMRAKQQLKSDILRVAERPQQRINVQRQSWPAQFIGCQYKMMRKSVLNNLLCLVVWNCFSFSTDWVSNHPNWRTHMFRGVAQPPTRFTQPCPVRSCNQLAVNPKFQDLDPVRHSKDHSSVSLRAEGSTKSGNFGTDRCLKFQRISWFASFSVLGYEMGYVFLDRPGRLGSGECTNSVGMGWALRSVTQK